VRDGNLIDVKYLFSVILSDKMGEMGIDHNRYTQDEIKSFVNECVDKVYAQAWAEFMAWVEFGDDKKAKTLAAIHALRGSWRG